MSDQKVIKVEKIKTQLFSGWAFGEGLHANYDCLACGSRGASDGGWAAIKCHDCGTTTITLGEYCDERIPSYKFWFNGREYCSRESKPSHWHINMANTYVPHCSCNTSGDNNWYYNIESGEEPSGTWRFGPFNEENDAIRDFDKNVKYCECGRLTHKTITCFCKRIE